MRARAARVVAGLLLAAGLGRALPAAAVVVIDPASRASVVAAYEHVYLPQAIVVPDWTGDVSDCLAGVTGLAYVEATIERVNFYRALSGLPGTVIADVAREPAAQAAALMMSANDDLDHDPPPDWLCWTQAGHDAAAQSDLALGVSGPAAITLYMADEGSSNSAAAHRRWILFPPQARMAVGNIPSGVRANALGVTTGFGARPSMPNGVSWPPQGYVPWQLLPAVSGRWSLSWPDADFDQATVTMTRDGQTLPAPALEPTANNYGYADNTLVWIARGVSYSRPDHDTIYHVHVAGISGGGAPASIDYDVIVIDPESPGSDVVFVDGFEG
jgi:hypothetical protein